MLKKSIRRGNMMLLIVLAIAAILISVRVGTASLFWENETIAFWGNLYIVIGLAVCLLGLLAAAIFLRPSKNGSPSVFPVALTAGLFGLALVIGNSFDAVMWIGFGRLPAPTEELVNLTDTILLGSTLLCGIFAGIYFIRVALVWIAEERFCTGLFRLSALLPTLWIWLRIARYELEHAGLVDIVFSVYDFLLFVFGMLFLFRFAGLSADVGRKRLSSLRFLAAATAVCGLSDTLVRFGLYLTRDAQLYQSIQLINGVDFFLSIFALAVMCFLWNGGLSHPRLQSDTDITVAISPAPQEDAPTEDAEEEISEPISEPIAPEEPLVIEKADHAAEEKTAPEDAVQTVENEEKEDTAPAWSVDDILNDILAARQLDATTD